MPTPVIVIGGGWAGLAAALHLSKHGVGVRLLEGARRLGGRARSVQLEEQTVDNGQHLLLGACSAVLQVLGWAGVELSDAFLRRPFGLHMRDMGGNRVTFRAPRLPPPLHLGAAICTARGLSRTGRLAGVWRARALLATAPVELAGTTVSEWLAQTRQPRALREWFWEPLCLAALNTPPEEASAALFSSLLQEVLAGPRAGSDLLLPRCNLDALYVEPVARQIRAQGGAVELGVPVIGVETADGEVRAVRTRERTIACRNVVLASGPKSAGKILETANEVGAARRASELVEKPITTVYLRYPRPVKLEEPFVGVVGSRTQWLFDRGLLGQTGMIAAVISADASHGGPPPAEVGQEVAQEVKTLYPDWPSPVRVWAVRERRATFAATPMSDRLRQPLITATKGLWVVGDYTATGLPGTLEGAVRSGLDCARAMLSAPHNRELDNADKKLVRAAIS